MDKASAKKKIEKSLKRNYYWAGREWPYKDVKPRIIAEKYMNDPAEDGLVDYKFFCFGGEPQVVYISKDISSSPRTDFFDMSFNHLPIRMRDPHSAILPEKPERFEEMQRIASILSEGHIHLRVDFYQVLKKVYVGELTFYHCSGMTAVRPEEWNEKLGSYIALPPQD